MTSTNKPAAKVSLYPVSAAIFRNASEKGDVFYNVTFERSYRDEKGEYQSSSSFGLGELLLLAKVANLAHSKIYELRAGDRQAEKLEE